jgi:hypothetical protein
MLEHNSEGLRESRLRVPRVRHNLSRCVAYVPVREHAVVILHLEREDLAPGHSWVPGFHHGVCDGGGSLILFHDQMIWPRNQAIVTNMNDVLHGAGTMFFGVDKVDYLSDDDCATSLRGGSFGVLYGVLSLDLRALAPHGFTHDLFVGHENHLAIVRL